MVLHILGTNIESLNKTIDDEGNIICITCKINLEVEGPAAVDARRPRIAVSSVKRPIGKDTRNTAGRGSLTQASTMS